MQVLRTRNNALFMTHTIQTRNGIIGVSICQHGWKKSVSQYEYRRVYTYKSVHTTRYIPALINLSMRIELNSRLFPV